MNTETMINILMMDGCTRRDAEDHIRKGVTIYENPGEWIETLKGNGVYSGETLDDVRKHNIPDTSMVTYAGHEYLIDYTL